MRYNWISPEPGTIELVEIETHRPIASIVEAAPTAWHWLRKTTLEEHGVPQADGMTSNLLEAKQAVIAGLRYG
jgi:hypothetical protein